MCNRIPPRFQGSHVDPLPSLRLGGMEKYQEIDNEQTSESQVHGRQRRSHKQQRARENSGEQEPSEDILPDRRDRQAELLAMQERATNERVDRCFEAALGVAEREAKRAKETAESRSRAENDHGEQSEGRSNRKFIRGMFFLFW